MTTQTTFPPLIRVFGDAPFWDSIKARRMTIQRCEKCSRFRYPVASLCPHCLSTEVQWVPVTGQAKLFSWSIFHRKYLPAYPPPHNIIVAQLAEGPLMVSNLVDAMPSDGCIGANLELVYAEDSAGTVLPRFRMS